MSPMFLILLLFVIVILLSAIGLELLKIRKLLESGDRTSGPAS